MGFAHVVLASIRIPLHFFGQHNEYDMYKDRRLSLKKPSRLTVVDDPSLGLLQVLITKHRKAHRDHVITPPRNDM